MSLYTIILLSQSCRVIFIWSTISGFPLFFLRIFCDSINLLVDLSFAFILEGIQMSWVSFLLTGNSYNSSMPSFTSCLCILQTLALFSTMLVYLATSSGIGDGIPQSMQVSADCHFWREAISQYLITNSGISSSHSL